MCDLRCQVEAVLGAASRLCSVSTVTAVSIPWHMRVTVCVLSTADGRLGGPQGVASTDEAAVRVCARVSGGHTPSRACGSQRTCPSATVRGQIASTVAQGHPSGARAPTATPSPGPCDPCDVWWLLRWPRRGQTPLDACGHWAPPSTLYYALCFVLADGKDFLFWKNTDNLWIADCHPRCVLTVRAFLVFM